MNNSGQQNQLNQQSKQAILNSESAWSQQSAYYNKQHQVRKMVILSVGLFLVGFFLISIVITNVKKIQVDAQVADAKSQLAKVQDDQKTLTEQVNSLNDPTYLQSVIRSKYQYTKTGEQIYNIPTNN